MKIERSSRVPRGFTRADLAGVLAGTFMVVLLLSSCGSTARTAAEAAGCANNLRHLSQAWLAHGAENPELLGNPQTGDIVTATRANAWAAGSLGWASESSNTNTLFLQLPGFAPYIGRDVSVFRCPSDRFLSAFQRDRGWRHRVRSYSMNGFVGGGSNPWRPGYRQFLRPSQIITPAETFVFVDEHADSINDPYFAVTPDGSNVPDLPGSLHSRGGNLSFADGRVERHGWVGTRIVLPVTAAFLPVIPAGRDADSLWLGERASQVLP